jgi:hypothetical protein
MSASEYTETAVEVAGISTGKNNASAGPPTIKKADARYKRDLFARFLWAACPTK